MAIVRAVFFSLFVFLLPCPLSSEWDVVRDHATD